MLRSGALAATAVRRLARGVTAVVRPCPTKVQLATRCVSSSASNHTTPASASTHTATSSVPSVEADIDFGSTRVPRSSKQGMVHDVFARVASSYDLMNDAMSGGVHRIWKYQLVDSLAPAENVKHLDVAGGTGDIAFRVLQAAERSALPPAYRTHAAASAQDESAAQLAARYAASPQVVVCDINDNMLRVGIDRARAQKLEVGELVSPVNPATAPIDPADLWRTHGPLSFVSGNAEILPFASGSFDSYTIVFGLRNVTDRDQALREALRVLKPGGRFMCMEFSHVTVPVVDKIYDAYSRAVIPALGEFLANDRASYAYLVESIQQMPDQETLAKMIQRAGFQAVSYRNLTGGVVAIHEGFKGPA